MSGALDLLRFTAMLGKETRQILRDPSTLMIALVLPVVLLFLCGYGVTLDTARTRIGLSVQDRSESEARCEGAFQPSNSFQLTERD